MAFPFSTTAHSILFDTPSLNETLDMVWQM